MSRPAVHFAACLLLAPALWPVGAAAQQSVISSQAIRLAVPPDIVIEAESLLPVAKATAGKVAVQDMKAFGDAWGGGSQLFWSSPKSIACLPPTSPVPKIPGVTDCARLAFWIPVEKPAWYRIVAALTSAPDYGDVRIRINGEAAPVYTGYSKGVSRTRLTLGEFFLPAGSTMVELEAIGKKPDSTGYLVGLDRLELWRLPPRTGSASGPAGSMQAVAGNVQLAGKPMGCEVRAEGCGWSFCSAGVIAINTTGAALPGGTTARYKVDYDSSTQVAFFGDDGETKLGSDVLPAGAEIRLAGVYWGKLGSPGKLSCSANALVMPQ